MISKKDSLISISRRNFFETVGALGLSSALWPAGASSDESTELMSSRYRPGRIDNEYSLFLPGEKAALKSPPAVTSLARDSVTALLNGHSLLMRPGDHLGGWCLLGIVPLRGTPTAIFEKHVSHRGAIAYVNVRDGLTVYIPKAIGQLANIRPRPIQTPHGVKLVRAERIEPGRPDFTAQYILDSAEDPCYENVAALGAEYIGWTLVANEEVGPQGSLYLDATGKSRQIAQEAVIDGVSPTSAEARRASELWAPDTRGAVFDPTELSSVGWIAQDAYEYVVGYSKRTLLGGYMPVANIGVWNPTQGAGYEVIVVLPPGNDAKPIGRLRFLVPKDALERLQADEKDAKKDPDVASVIDDLVLSESRRTIASEKGQTYCENYWNGTAEDFYTALAVTWWRWYDFHRQAMQVDIPDEWLQDAAQAGLTLSRCSYRGLEPSYQIGEGKYTAFRHSPDCTKGGDFRDAAFFDSLFPVAHYQFVWAHQLWNHVQDGDRYFQYYLDNYVLANGNFVYNTQDQVEAPLNIGVFLANSARSYFYSRDLGAFERRLPILERMIRFALERYEYSKAKFPTADRRRGLIWGSPEADLGSSRKDGPEDHPYYYQNAAWIWRGLVEHARALGKASEDSGRKDFALSASHYHEIAREMRTLIEVSLAGACAAGNNEMKAAGVTPFRPDDTNRKVTHLTDYENHRFMEDWFLADWGAKELDLGHLKHRELSGRKLLGMPLSHGPTVTSNFMAHGTLSVLIRQDDYRPFLLTLYALACYAADCGNRYSPEDAVIPGGHPLAGPSAFWSAVVNSTLQPTLGLRWLLCYEEWDNDICHLQKAAPKHWFSAGQEITVRNCPTRFGSIGWSTHTMENRQWAITVDVSKGFAADLIIHVHPDDGLPLRATSLGLLQHNRIVVPRSLIAHTTSLRIVVS